MPPLGQYGKGNSNFELPEEGLYLGFIESIEDAVGSYQGEKKLQWRLKYRLFQFADGEPCGPEDNGEDDWKPGLTQSEWVGRTLGEKSTMLKRVNAILGPTFPDGLIPPGYEITTEALIPAPSDQDLIFAGESRAKCVQVNLEAYKKSDGSEGRKISAVLPLPQRRKARAAGASSPATSARKAVSQPEPDEAASDEELPF